MPTRANAIVTCSCNWKLGDIRRFESCEDMAAVELALLERSVPRLVRHWRLGHTLRLREGAPVEFAAVIAKAAREMAESENGAVGEDAAPAVGLIGAGED